MSTPPISVIIAAYNSERFITACVDSVLQEPGNQYEIIVIDDGSPDGTVDCLKHYAQNRKVTVIPLRKNGGVAHARNVGIKKSKGAYLLFLDADTEIRPGWSDAILNLFETHRETAIALCKILKFDTNRYDSAGEKLSSFFFLFDRARGARDTAQFERISPVFSGKAAGMIVKRTVCNKIQGFDEEYHWTFEETDFCWRTWLTGRDVIFFPGVTVYHHYVTEGKGTAYYAARRVIYRGARNTIRGVIKNAETHNLLLRLPIHVSIWFVLAILMACKGKWSESRDLLQGIMWNVINVKKTWQARKIVQRMRVRTDSEIFATVGTQQSIGYYIGKAWAYVNGKPY